MARRRYGYSNLVCYALSVAKGLQDSEPRTFKEALNDSMQ